MCLNRMNAPAACCLLSFLYFHWLFPLLARETSSGKRSIYKSTRERVDSKGLCGRCRLHLMGSCFRLMLLPLHFLILKSFISQKIVFEMGDLFLFSSFFQVSRVFFYEYRLWCFLIWRFRWTCYLVNCLVFRLDFTSYIGSHRNHWNLHARFTCVVYRNVPREVLSTSESATISSKYNLHKPIWLTIVMSDNNL